MLRKFLVLTTLFVTALTASAEFRWGPQVGANFSTFHWKQTLIPTDMRTGFQAGVLGEIMIPGIGFGLDLGLRYNLHGAHLGFSKWPVWSSDGIESQDAWQHVIEIPLNLKFKWTRLNGVERTIAPFIFGGPVFSFKLGYNSQPALVHPGGYVSMQCGGGAELFEHWQISAGYSWGISYEIRTIKLDNLSAQPRSAFVNVAYLF